MYEKPLPTRELLYILRDVILIIVIKVVPMMVKEARAPEAVTRKLNISAIYR